MSFSGNVPTSVRLKHYYIKTLLDKNPVRSLFLSSKILLNSSSGKPLLIANVCVCFSVMLYIVFRTVKRLIRPPDIVCRRTYILPVFLLLLCFRRLISEVAERNSTKIGHMVGSKCNLKTHIRNLGYPLPLQIGGQKTTFLGRLLSLTAI